jgi:hypothetical protein
MRHPMLLSAMVFLGAAMPAVAQNYPAQAVILQKEVEVRAGPGTMFDPTSKLYQNDRVVVLREVKDQPGWLEIKPPDRSFSWVNGKNIKQVDSLHAYVDCDPSRPVSTFAGSQLVNVQPTRESMKLTSGTVLIIVGPPTTASNGDTWFRIQPNPSEVRYIPADAVKPTTTIVATNVGAPNWAQGPNGYNTNSTLSEAEKALSINDVARAKQLFQQVASTSTDSSQKQYAMNRLASLSANQPVQATTTSLSPSKNAGVNLLTTKAPDWTKYGRLWDTKLVSENGQPLYKLEDGVSKTPIYVTTQPGTSLQMYIGRTIAVFGPTMYRPDAPARMDFIVASHVAVP